MKVAKGKEDLMRGIESRIMVVLYKAGVGYSMVSRVLVV